jgi:hypothetical protein
LFKYIREKSYLLEKFVLLRQLASEKTDFH